MLERVLRIVLAIGVVAPMFLFSKFIGDNMLAGMSKSEAVVMSLGCLAPVSWVFLLGLYTLEVWKNSHLSKQR
jgi:hypothetical protein